MTWAPQLFTISAAAMIWARLSTAQGPAITMRRGPPIGTPRTLTSCVVDASAYSGQ